MVERNFLFICVIILYLGFVLGFNVTTEKDLDEDDYEVAVHAGNADPGLLEDPKNLSCISCNNVKFDECNDPKNKLVPSALCQNYDDVCYSMHTPFGVIDRGCYNPNRTMTTYVCPCNYCNNLPFKLLPVYFTTVQDWVANVIDLSHTRGLRKSVLKKISCVQCTANATSQPSYNSEFNNISNCYDGNITELPVEECSNDEICGIKYISNQTYIWRGCIQRPRYNYWWSFCRDDLCNNEVLGSLYNYFYNVSNVLQKSLEP